MYRICFQCTGTQPQHVVQNHADSPNERQNKEAAWATWCVTATLSKGCHWDELVCSVFLGVPTTNGSHWVLDKRFCFFVFGMVTTPERVNTNVSTSRVMGKGHQESKEIPFAKVSFFENMGNENHEKAFWKCNCSAELYFLLLTQWNQKNKKKQFDQIWSNLIKIDQNRFFFIFWIIPWKKKTWWFIDESLPWFVSVFLLKAVGW